MTVEQVKRPCVYALIGAVSFWSPDILIKAIAGKRFSGTHVQILTFVMPASTIMSLMLLNRISCLRHQASIGPSILAGIWLLGGLAMTASWSFSGGGFARAEGLGLVTALLGALPPYTFIMSPYDGSFWVLS
jgi:hypothetical protein